LPNAADLVNPFWDWSLRVYAEPPVAACCLALQEELGVDVNLALLGAYLAAQQQCWSTQSLGACVDAVSAWRREVVQPLRAARHALRVLAPDQPLRTLLKEAELAAERHQQDLLWSVLADYPPEACADDALLHNLSLLAGAAFAEPAWQRLLAALRSQ